VSEELRRTVRIVNRLGMHARAATSLSEVASRFDAEVRLEKDGQAARSTSVIELLLLCGQAGSEVDVVTRGPEAEQALRAVTELIADRFGEGQ